jgi:GWxTD domain-containing protein
MNWILLAFFLTPYEKWLNEDVAYIVTPDERALFQRLIDDEERKQFIAQFWRRRDPDPATAENPAEEEHYRRIAYSARFGKSGWRSDQGRIYIVNGPPDEAEIRPGKNTIWRYRTGVLAGQDLEFDAGGKQR